MTLSTSPEYTCAFGSNPNAAPFDSIGETVVQRRKEGLRAYGAALGLPAE